MFPSTHPARRHARSKALSPLLAIVWLVLLAALPAQAATFRVNSTGDRVDLNPGDGSCDTGFDVISGMFSIDECTLRAAIQQANATLGADVITFWDGIDEDVNGRVVIYPLTPLPAVTGTTSFDGTSRSDYDDLDPWAEPVIYLDGSAVGFADGLAFSGSQSGSSVHAMGFIEWSNGIHVDANASDFWVEGSRLGLLGNAAGNGNTNGIQVVGGDATIGKQCTAGVCTGKGNVVGNNTGFGIDIFGARARIDGNRIGTDSTGLLARSNSLGGINIVGQDAVVGHPTVGAAPGEGGNLIAGNGQAGILAQSANPKIESNLVGLDATGTQALPNDIGIWLFQGTGHVGGAQPGEGNVVAGNVDEEILIFETIGTTVEGNRIGLAPSGIQTFSSGFHACVSLLGATQTMIRNNIMGGVRRGIELEDSDFNTLHGNLIGTDNIGSDLQIQFAGISTRDSSHNNIGSLGVAPNVLGHMLTGVLIESGDHNRVLNNDIGITPGGIPTPVNAGVRIFQGVDSIVGAGNNTPGVAFDATENVIYATAEGVTVFNDQTQRHAIRGNRIYDVAATLITLSLFPGNDPGDADTGPNEYINHPEIDAGALAWDDELGVLDIRYRIDSPTSPQPLTIDFYARDPNGIRWFGSDIITGENLDVYRDISIAPPPGVVVNGRDIYATTTDSKGTGNTSQYSPPVGVPEPGVAMSLCFGAGGLAALRRVRRR